MTRDELTAPAERAVRRGEMKEAVRLYEELARAQPGDPQINQRLEALRAALQPSEIPGVELPPEEQSGVHTTPLTPEQEGELLHNLGDYAGAAAAYRRALHDKPDSELIKERLVELYQLAQAMPRHSPTDATLPRQAEPMLKALLDRIAARKRLRLS